MTTRLLEECFDLEEREDCKYIRFPEKATLIVFDPYMINAKDLINAKPGEVTLIRLRRPAWGRGDIHEYIHIMEVPKCHTILRKN